MNFQPPPENGNLEDLQKWCRDLYRFLQDPVFHTIRFYPKGTAAINEKGRTYCSSSDNKLKTHNGTAYQNLY